MDVVRSLIVEPFSSDGLACYVELGFWIRSFCPRLANAVLVE